MFDLELLIPKIVAPLSLLLLYLIVFWVSKWAANKFTPYDINKEISEKHNKAIAISLSGYFIAVTIIFVSVLIGPSHGIVQDLILVGGYSVVGIVLLNVSRVINDKLILYKFKNKSELVDDQNEGTGAVVAGSFIASGLIVAGAVHGEGGGIVTAIAFFAVGQLALILFSKVYNLITPYDIHDEIEKDNVAAGIAFGGALIALGIILMNGASGNFISWGYNLSRFALISCGALIVLPIFRYIMDKCLIPHYDLNHEIHNDRNISAGILELVMVVCFASIVFFVI
ncbi:MAG: uncharacterized membrane protein YjfL (UPF0719 family) [Cellvibrionaceae bacterium]|jgi:uncharacterized membrane protein YjfL (UPF0719 family)